jgi:hypothetical protein
VRLLSDGPFPGTDLWNNARTCEIEISKAWEQFCKLSFTEDPERLSTTFDLKHLTADELTSLYRGIYRMKRKTSFRLKPTATG